MSRRPESNAALRATTEGDDRLVSADALAQRPGMSRDEFIVAALGAFAGRHTADGATERLDRVYADDPGSLDAGTRHARRRTLTREEW